MPLEKQVVDIPFGSGIREREADHLLQAPGAFELENFDFEQAGGYRPRDGFSALGLTGLSQTPPPNSLFSYDGVLHLNSFKSGIYARTTTGDRWVQRNEASQHPLEIRVREQLRLYTGVSEVDSVVHGGYIVVAWNLGVQSGSTKLDAYVAILDASTLGIVVPATKLEDLGYGVRVCPFFKSNVSYVAVLGVEDGGGNPLNGAIVNLSVSPPTIGAVTQITTGVTLSTSRAANFDAHGHPSESFFNVVYWDSAAGQTKCFKSDDGLTVLASQNVATNSSKGRAIYHSNTQATVYVAISDGVDVKAFTINEAYSSVGTVRTLFTDRTNGTTLDTLHNKLTLVDRLSNGNIWVAFSPSRVGAEGSSSALANAIIHEVVFTDIDPTTAIQTGTVGRLFGALLAGKAFSPANHEPHVPLRIAAWIGTDTLTPATHASPHSSYLLGALYDPTRVVVANNQGESSVIVNNDPRLKIVGRFFQDRYFDQELNSCSANHLPTVSLRSGTEWSFLCQVETATLAHPRPGVFPTEKLDSVKGADFVFIETKPPPCRYVGTNDLMYSSGALPGVFDGLNHVEAAPLAAPGFPYRSVVVGGGNGPKNNTKYKALWFWRDARGRVHRGPVSLAVTLTQSVDSLTLYYQYPPTNLDGENGQTLLLAVYRKDPGGSNYYFHCTIDASIPPAITPSPINPINPIDHAATRDGFIKFLDISANVNTANPILYTDGGEVDSLCPPPTLDIVAAGDRLHWISGEAANEVWSSKTSGPFKPAEMGDSLVTYVTDLDEALVALATLDDKPVAFSRNSVFYLSGSGFTDGGLGGYTAQRISADIGCVKRNTVVGGVFGVLFESDRGVYLLDRGLSIQYIGEAVQDDFKEATCQRAFVLDKRNQVWFVFTDRVLVWDYIQNAWTKFTPSTVASGGEGPTVHTILDGVRHLSDAYITMQNTVALRIWKYDSTVSTDNSARIVPKILTPWIKLTSLQGFARLWRVLVLGSNDTTGGNLSVKAYVNYDNSSAAWTKRWRKTDRSSGERLQVKIHNEDQKIESVRFEITGETIDGGAFDLAARYTLSGITMEAGILPGSFKHLPAVDRK